jgi:hypothetical protein
MGNVAKRSVGPVMPILSTRVQTGTAVKVSRAAKAIDQPVAAWLRIAIMEKLTRDGYQSEEGRQ